MDNKKENITTYMTHHINYYKIEVNCSAFDGTGAYMLCLDLPCNHKSIDKWPLLFDN